MSSNSSQHPSIPRLLKATAIAVIIACVVLVTTVLPAEYGIDPTGIGAKLGLNKISEAAAAKELTPSLGNEPIAEKQPVAVSNSSNEEKLDAVGQPVKPIDDKVVTKHEGDFRTETMTVTIAPNKGAEIKTKMKAGDSFVFYWQATGGQVASDMHGDKLNAAEGEYTSYWIATPRASASGSFTAAFEGKHGWYWLNRSDKPVTLTVKVSGFQTELFRP